MFERFSKEARAAVVEAQQVARASASRSIDTRHVLVALAEADGPASRAMRKVGIDPQAVTADLRDHLRASGLDPEALASLGIDLDAVRERSDALFGEGALDRVGRETPKGHIPFTRDAKKALELALREAVRLQDKGIHGGHLLLGILRADSPAGRALVAAGADVATLRAAVEQQRPAA